MENVSTLMSELEAIRAELRKDKKEKKPTKKKGKHKKGKIKSKKKKGSPSTSRSSRSRSSSRTSSSSSSEFLRWSMKARDQAVSPAQLAKVDAERFKRRADLLRFATEHPGALSAHFLSAVRIKLGRGTVTRSKQLRDVPMAEWVQSGHSGLSEVRDQREALTLAAAMDALSRSDVARAMDLLSMRLVALQKAKCKGGSWEKAQTVELIPAPGTELGPAGLTALV